MDTKKLKFVWLLLVLLQASNAHAQTKITVSAAASLQNVLTKLGAQFEAKNRTSKVSFNFGSSGALQKQIENGAPVDVFISAAARNVDELQKQKLVDAKSKRIIARNGLVLIVASDSKLKLARFRDALSPRIKHLAIGGPEVPAGQRAQEVFEKLGIWTQIKSKAVRAKDVRAALAQVELGNAEAGVVYRSDAASSRRVRVVATAPASMHKPIVYPAVTVSSSRNLQAARGFVRYLASPAAQKEFVRAGFRKP